jgi:hypothetical protein
MIGLGGMMKLAKGGLGPDDLKEILSAAGMELDFNLVAPSLETFRPLAASASLPGSKLLELKGTMKGGGQIHALLVMNQQSDKSDSCDGN